MENAVDALKMAAAILIFIIAIGSSFSLFSTAKQTADSIITMRDKQAYLEAAELDGILYTSSSAILGDTQGLTQAEIEALKKQESDVGGLTKNGDRIVSIADVISTIYRYSKEKYGVTIIKGAGEIGEVIARYDSGTESLMNIYNTIEEDKLKTYVEELTKNISTIYTKANFTTNKLEELYKLESGGYGAPWYGNDKQIERRITCDISGETFVCNNKTYKGKNLLRYLSGKKIVEVTNEIDTSKYLEDNGQQTDLLQQFNMPTVEIVYIIL